MKTSGYAAAAMLLLFIIMVSTTSTQTSKSDICKRHCQRKHLLCIHGNEFTTTPHPCFVLSRECMGWCYRHFALPLTNTQ
ncbi:hypothetical protein LSAT2_025209 [Lamellibrachia satsuma]|nr:hypothetical protein LSAT2_025209 [Lamellibrachia satsuma]